MIEIKDLSKTFGGGESSVEALRDVDISIADGSVFGIIGLSGAGKSTLVRCINMLERPSSGTVEVNGRDMGSLTPSQLRAARRGIAMIFQQFNLLMQRSCLGNVLFPMQLAGVPTAEAKKRALELLELVGLPDKANAYPSQLSGGQKQRIAIARALATRPEVLLCDEATSALDPSTTRQILSLIKDINEKFGITVVVITHQMSVVQEICDHVAIMDGGRVVEQGSVEQIFSAPRSEAGRRLVFPGRDADVAPAADDRRIRVVFRDNQTAGRPIVATMAKETGIAASVLAADTRQLSGGVFGNMLLSISSADFDRAFAYLSANGRLAVEEVTEHARQSF